jgi:ABC-2 type transport system ATP-binding protein
VEKSKKLLEFMKLEEGDRITTFSKGMVEKLHLTLVLSRKAKLYIFDEPLYKI